MPKKVAGTLAETAYRIVLARILSHELAGGSVIQERKLAIAMGISRTPMRDALGRLEGEGLLVRLTDRLLAVRVITLQDYLHTLDVRAMIEPQAAGLAARNLGDDDAIRLQRELAALEASAEPADAVHWAFDDSLHETIAKLSGNPFMAETIREMRRYTTIFERQTVPPRSKPGLDDHQRIVAALSSGKPERARETMAEHIRNVRRRMLDSL